MEDKVQRMRKQRNLVTIMLASAGLIVLVVGLLFMKAEQQQLMIALGIGMMAGAFVARLINPRFGNKPSRNEFEKES